MAKKAKKTETAKSNGTKLNLVQPDTAGIDIAKDVMQVCVPSDRCEDNNREFGAFTQDLHAISAWLKECGIKRVVMESTGIYWVRLFDLLDEDGFECVLVNPRMVKNLNARKTDMADAEWLLFIGAYDLYENSFHLRYWSNEIKQVNRHRNTLIKDSSRHVQHMQKSLEMMNVKLSSVISDITGKSGLSIIEAILNGERNPERLASLADPRCRKTSEEIAKGLEGTWNTGRLLELKHAYDSYRALVGQIAECDDIISSLIESNINIQTETQTEFERTEKKQTKAAHAINFDIEKHCYEAWGMNAMTLPGIAQAGILTLFSELGTEFISRFDTVRKFLRWCNLAPNDKISGGKLLSCHIDRRGNVVGQVFRQAASTLWKDKSPMGDYYRRKKSKGGGGYANLATANKLATIFFMMVKHKTNYDETKWTKKNSENIEKKINALKKKLARLENEAAAMAGLERVAN